MEKITSIIAIGISFVALLFGGLLNSRWEKEINSAEISVSINTISYGIRKIADRPIPIPDDLVRYTNSARFFPTLEPNMSRLELDKVLNDSREKNFEEAALELALANSELSQGNLTEYRVKEIWGNISSESKATMFAVRTSRRIKEKLREVLNSVDEDRLTSLIDMLESNADNLSDSKSEGLLQKPEVQAAFMEVLRETAELEIRPNKQQILDIFRSELPFLQAAAAEDKKYCEEVQRLISQADNLAQNAPTYWDVSVTFFNSGGVPNSVMPAAVLLVQREAKNNTTVFLSPIEKTGNVVVEPGKAISMLFRSDEKNNPEILKGLINNYKSKEKDFRILFSTIDGKQVLSQRSNFSDGIADKQRETMIKEAESLML